MFQEAMQNEGPQAAECVEPSDGFIALQTIGQRKFV